jgi:TBC1 domain family member 5
MLLEKMCAPDGSYADGFIVPGMSVSPKTAVTPGNLETNNPLSLHNEVRMQLFFPTATFISSPQNPWTDWFASVELRKTIQQDVERT